MNSRLLLIGAAGVAVTAGFAIQDHVDTPDARNRSGAVEKFAAAVGGVT
jgi:hypothetical protein